MQCDLFTVTLQSNEHYVSPLFPWEIWTTRRRNHAAAERPSPFWPGETIIANLAVSPNQTVEITFSLTSSVAAWGWFWVPFGRRILQNSCELAPAKRFALPYLDWQGPYIGCLTWWNRVKCCPILFFSTFRVLAYYFSDVVDDLRGADAV